MQASCSNPATQSLHMTLEENVDLRTDDDLPVFIRCVPVKKAVHGERWFVSFSIPHFLYPRSDGQGPDHHHVCKSPGWSSPFLLRCMQTGYRPICVHQAHEVFSPRACRCIS